MTATHTQEGAMNRTFAGAIWTAVCQGLAPHVVPSKIADPVHKELVLKYLASTCQGLSVIYRTVKG